MGIEMFPVVIEGVVDRPWKGDRYERVGVWMNRRGGE
jgi:hypothetical protein